MDLDDTPVMPVEPLLFRHASPRISSTEIPGNYDADMQVWAIETANGLTPIVTVGSTSMLDTNTVTRVRQEGDDEDMARDDVTDGSGQRYSLAELQTKTDAQQERDDESPFNSLLEMQTKTFAQIERDDESPMMF